MLNTPSLVLYSSKNRLKTCEQFALLDPRIPMRGIWTVFMPFYPVTSKKVKILKKWKKKMPGDIIILHKCTKSHDHMLYCSWEVAHDSCNFQFSFWAIFCPFQPKKSKLKKNKTLGDIILHMCTKSYGQMMLGSWDIVCNR